MLLLGDSKEQLKTLADNSVDAVVTDPLEAIGSTKQAEFEGIA